MLDFVLCLVALIAGGFLFELFAAAQAPRGYQDEQGFQFGTPAQQAPDESVLALATVKPVRATAVARRSASLEPSLRPSVF